MRKEKKDKGEWSLLKWLFLIWILVIILEILVIIARVQFERIVVRVDVANDRINAIEETMETYQLK